MMIWLFILPILITAGSALLYFPRDALRMAMRNGRRSDGVRSEARTRREIRHGRRLARRIILTPVLIIAASAGVMQVFHLYAMPDTVLADVFGENHPEVSLHAPDLEAWADAIDASHQEEDYRQWRRAQGIDTTPSSTLQRQLAGHWPVHLVFLFLLAAFALWYALRISPHAISSYRKGVFSRSREYLHKDLESALG